MRLFIARAKYSIYPSPNNRLADFQILDKPCDGRTEWRGIYFDGNKAKVLFGKRGKCDEAGHTSKLCELQAME